MNTKTRIKDWERLRENVRKAVDSGKQCRLAVFSDAEAEIGRMTARDRLGRQPTHITFVILNRSELGKYAPGDIITDKELVS